MKIGTDVLGRDIYGVRDPDSGALHTIDPQTGQVNSGPQAGNAPSGSTATGTIGSLPGQAEHTAQMIANYEIPPLAGFAMNRPFGQAVMGRVSELNPDYSAPEYNSRNKAVTAFNTGKQGDQIKFFNNSVQHLGTLDNLITAMGSGDVQAVNRVRQYFQNQFGQEAPGDFDAAKNIVGQEIVKSIVANGGGEGERQAAAATLAAAKSPEQLRGIINTYKELAGAQLRDLKLQYENATGLHNFEKKLIPESQAQLAAVEARAATTNAAATAPAPKEGDRKQFKQGWGVYRNGQWVPETP
jgi:hypothetical protein